MPFECIPLADDSMLAVLSRSHPLAGEDRYPLKKFNEEKFIMPAFVYDDDVKLPLDPPQHITLGIAIHSLEDASPAVK